MSLYPQRNWGIMLQIAWNLRMKDKLTGRGFNGGGGTPQAGKKSNRDICYRFNRGKCSYGSSCKFEHHCALCSKYGHGAWNCRRGGGGTPTTASPTLGTSQQNQSVEKDQSVTKFQFKRDGKDHTK